MYNTDIRYGSAFRSSSGGAFFPKENAKKKVHLPESSLSSSSLKSEGSTTTQASSEKLIRAEVSSPFSDQNIQQVETSSCASDMLKAAYRNSNRGGVTLGLAGGLIGAVHGGASGASFGMSVGSSLGAHLGGLTGVVGGIGGALTVQPIDAKEGANFREEVQDIAQSDHFLGRVVQVVDHAGHHAAVSSIGVGGAVLLGSLAIGIPFSAAFHAAEIYSGAVWAFGLTTGSAHWILRHVNESKERLEREERNSPGDIELSSLSSSTWREVDPQSENKHEFTLVEDVRFTNE